jgi:hypothetical protein
MITGVATQHRRQSHHWILMGGGRLQWSGAMATVVMTGLGKYNYPSYLAINPVIL